MGLFSHWWLYQTSLYLLKNADARLIWHLQFLRFCQTWTLRVDITADLPEMGFEPHQCVLSFVSLAISGVTKTTSVDRRQWQPGTKWLECPGIGIFKMKPAYNFRWNRPKLSESGAVPSRDVQLDGLHKTLHTATLEWRLDPSRYLTFSSFIYSLSATVIKDCNKKKKQNQNECSVGELRESEKQLSFSLRLAPLFRPAEQTNDILSGPWRQLRPQRGF